jgi:UDP-2-acetamido-2-deoxy-ribo-hexuluronate aminotransferase
MTEKRINFIDLKAQQEKILPALNERIQRVLAHGQYIMGPEVKELEERLAAYVGAKHSISCSSCTDALLMPLLAYGVGTGDAIFNHPLYLHRHGGGHPVVGGHPDLRGYRPQDRQYRP